MGLFGNQHAKSVPVGILPEEFENVRVMKDDLDDLSRKKDPKSAPKSKVVPDMPSDAGISASNKEAKSDNPFLGGDVETGSALDASSNRHIASGNSIPEKSNVASIVSASDPHISFEAIPGKAAPPAPPAPVTVLKKTSRSGKSGPKKSVIIIVVVSASVLIAGAIASVLFLGSSGQPDTVPASSDPIVNNEMPAVSEDIPSPDDSILPSEASEDPNMAPRIDSPNYLPIDTETATASDIVEVIRSAAEQVGGMPELSPVEFLVRDSNNNPVAFSRFAYLLGLSVSEDTLSMIDESFSLYLVPEGNSVRTALFLKVKDVSALPSLMTRDEESLPIMFGTLLYGSVFPGDSSVSFRDGSFGVLRTRFTVLDSVTGRSLDYAFLGNGLAIGASKDSFRAVLGKIAQEGSGKSAY
jgi:hypothetical protein